MRLLARVSSPAFLPSTNHRDPHFAGRIFPICHILTNVRFKAKLAPSLVTINSFTPLAQDQFQLQGFFAPFHLHFDAIVGLVFLNLRGK
jgi:hypothetical protein